MSGWHRYRKAKRRHPTCGALSCSWFHDNGCLIYQGRPEPQAPNKFTYRLQPPDGTWTDFDMLKEAKAAGQQRPARCSALMASETTGGALRECGASIANDGYCLNGHEQAASEAWRRYDEAHDEGRGHAQIERSAARKAFLAGAAQASEALAALAKVRAVIDHARRMPGDREPMEPWLSDQVRLKSEADAAVLAATGGKK